MYLYTNLSLGQDSSLCPRTVSAEPSTGNTPTRWGMSSPVAKGGAGKHITASTTQPKENLLYKPDLVNALINNNEILGKHSYVLIRLKDLVSIQ